jgi:hypothetical protein
MDAYTPSNTAAATCPKVTAGKWEAQSSPLPAAPNAQLCSCMSETLSCVVADSTDEKDYGDMFGFICGEKASTARVSTRTLLRARTEHTACAMINRS